jgi:hypothetical protein
MKYTRLDLHSLGHNVLSVTTSGPQIRDDLYQLWQQDQVRIQNLSSVLAKPGHDHHVKFLRLTQL